MDTKATTYCNVFMIRYDVAVTELATTHGTPEVFG